MDRVLDIWLAASLRAHGFVAPGFWRSQVQAMRETWLPASEVCVHQGDDGVDGFLALAGDTLAALFVSPERQGRGVGTALLRHAKGLRRRLELSVYTANPTAVGFYEANGFCITGRRTDAHTGQPEYLMRWASREG